MPSAASTAEDVALSDHHGLPDIERAHGRQHLESARDVGGGLRIGLVAPERARWGSDVRRHLMGAEQAKSVALEDAADAGQEMIVAAAKGADDARHLDHGRPVEPHLADRGAHQPTDQHEVAAALGAGEPAKPPELADRDPAMRIGCDRLRIDEAAQGEQHDPTPAALNRRRDRQRNAAAAADDAERPLVRRRYRHWSIVTGPSSQVLVGPGRASSPGGWLC